MSTSTADASRPGSGRISPHWQTALLLFVFLNALFLLTSTGRVHTIDEISTVLQTSSIVHHGSTAVPQAVRAGIWYGKRDLRGQPRSPYPAGQAIATAPWFVFGEFVLAKLPGVPRSSQDLIVSMAATWSNATFAAVAATLAFLLFAARGLSQQRALLGAFAIALGTPLFVYSAGLFSEPLTAALLLGAALALFGLAPQAVVSAGRAAVAGVLLGCTLYIRPTNLLLAFVFIGAVAIAERPQRVRAAAIVAALVGIAGLAYLAQNLALYGNMMDFGYPSTAEGGRELNTFHNPLFVGIAGYLFSPGKSIFLFCPLALVAIAGLPRLWKLDRSLAALCTITPLVYLVLYSKLTNWEGGYNYGPRYMVPSLVLLSIAVGALLASPPPKFFRWFGAAFAGGLLVQLIGLATNVMEDMVNNGYYVGNWEYRMSYSPIAGQLHLIGKYLGGAPAPLGMGFDRWFLFWSKAGAPLSSALWLLVPMVLAVALTADPLLRRLRGKESSS